MMAAHWKQQGKSLHERLDELFAQHGPHEESLVNVQMEGSEGMGRMRELMAAFRTRPPQALGGIAVAAVRDYQALTVTPVGGTAQALSASPADMVMLDLAEAGNYFAVRHRAQSRKSSSTRSLRAVPAHWRMCLHASSNCATVWRCSRKTFVSSSPVVDGDRLAACLLM